MCWYCEPRRLPKASPEQDHEAGEHGTQGLAAAAATREAAKRKREQQDGAGPAAKAPRRAARPIPVISHEVAVPKGYDAAARNLDPATYGAHCSQYKLADTPAYTYGVAVVVAVVACHGPEAAPMPAVLCCRSTPSRVPDLRLNIDMHACMPVSSSRPFTQQTRVCTSGVLCQLSQLRVCLPSAR